MEERIKQKLKELPRKPGVYLMKDKTGRVLYVGKAKDLSKRVPSYFHKDLPSPWIEIMVGQIADIETITVNSEFEALLLENNLIKKYKTQFNTRMRDDKTFPFLKFTNEEFPRLIIVRKITRDGGQYFGPYLSAFALRKTIEFLRRHYGIVTHTYKKGQRPCLNYQLGLCSAPYAGMISKAEYDERVQQSIKFIKGEYRNLLKSLEKKMKAEAREMKYENAAQTRNQIEAINRLVSSQIIVSTKQSNKDIFAVVKLYDAAVCHILKIRGGKMLNSHSVILDRPEASEGELIESVISQYYLNNFDIPREVVVSHPFGGEDLITDVLSGRDGKVKITLPNTKERRELIELAEQNAEENLRSIINKTKLNEEILLKLKEDLNLPKLPERIEAYDISNLGAKQAVGAMVTFVNAVPFKNHYRKFIIRTVEGQNDFGMMKEILRRRFLNKELPKPNLILIDGGKGQLNAALAIMKELEIKDVPAIGLAKKYELIFKPGADLPVALPMDSKSLLLLRAIRDEVHRFGIGFHRFRRGKEFLK